MWNCMEARAGIEPANSSFAGCRLTTWPPRLGKICTRIYTQDCTQIARTTPIYVDCFPSKPLKTMSRGVFRKVLQTFALPLGDRATVSGKNQAHKLWHSRSDSFRAKS